MALNDMQYIGDGVYVGHDGYQVWLSVGSHLNPPVVALDPRVMANLVQYWEQSLGVKLNVK